MYWSAILSPRSRVSRGSRFLPRWIATSVRESFQKRLSTVGALLEAEDAQLEHLQRLLLLRDRVVPGLAPCCAGFRPATISRISRTTFGSSSRGTRRGGDLLRRADLDVAEDVHDDARVVRDDRAPGLRDDVRLGDLLVLADPLHVVDDVADVLLDRVVHRRGVPVVARADVVDAEAAADVEVLDREPHLAELRVDARALVHRVLHDADLGELAADVEVEELRAVLLPGSPSGCAPPG